MRLWAADTDDGGDRATAGTIAGEAPEPGGGRGTVLLESMVAAGTALL